MKRFPYQEPGRGVIVSSFAAFPGAPFCPFTGHGSSYQGGNGDEHKEDYAALSLGMIQVRRVSVGYPPPDFLGDTLRR